MSVKRSGMPLDEQMKRILRNGEKAMTEALISGLAYATEYTPLATGALINSQYRAVRVEGGRITGWAGYFQDYAIYLNNSTKWKPKPPPKKVKGKTVNAWNANATPRFLQKGFEDAEQEIKQILLNGFKIK